MLNTSSKPSIAKDKTEITSKLMPLIDWVNENINKTELPEIVKYCYTYIKGSTIAPKDKVRTLSHLQEIQDKTKLQLFLYNSMLKFEGLGVVGHLPR